MSDAPPVLVLGASGHGKVAAATAQAAGRTVVGFADAAATLRGSEVMGLPVVATTDDEVLACLAEHRAELFVAIGANAVRQRVGQRFEEHGVTLATLVHPTAWLAPNVPVGRGTLICAGAIVQPGSTIGAHVILNTAATVDHDGRIDDVVHLSPGVHLGGTVHVAEGAWLGVGVSVRNNQQIGAWATVGVGAVVVSDIPPRVVAVGVPARPVR